jgi:sulfotransferase family protein
VTTAGCIGERGERLVFIVGAPRSGTTWLQRLMGAHPSVATTQETELLNRYCQTWVDIWDSQLPDDPGEWERRRHRGLPAVLTADEFDRYVRGFAERVYAEALALRPTARVVVDKNPEYSLCIPLIRRMYPEAGVIHLVRDGRDVATSLLAAGHGWGREWAPRRLRLAADTWRTCVESALTARDSGRYLQVRYEDLGDSRVLAECFGFAGIAATPDECAESLARFDLRTGRSDGGDDSILWSGEVIRRLGAPPAEPSGFFGAGTSGRWRETWTARDRSDFEQVAGDLLRELGYDAGEDWAASTAARRLGERIRVQATGAATRLGWRLHMLLGRRGVYLYLSRIEPYPRDGAP